MSLSAVNSGVSLPDLLQNLDDSGLDAMQQAVTREKEKRIRKISDIYGKTMTEILGAETIYNLPEISPEKIGLYYGYNGTQLKDSKLLKGQSVVRGILRSKNPFIAVRFDLFDENHQKIATLAEPIFLRQSDNKDHYTTPHTNLDDENEQHESYLSSLSCSHGIAGMTRKELQGLRDLIEGKEIEPPSFESYSYKSKKTIKLADA